ncbi:MAG: hypothetical protein HY319_25845 [Armatimonadetes bacterium]|nr:hypothetical protein [Armatimonadota bacterium]
MTVSVLNYHRLLFHWHHRKFFKFRRHLTQKEKDYLEACFRLAESFEEVSDSGYAHFSYYSYSHRVNGDRVNSSRLAYGSVRRPREALAAALPVLEERGVSLPDFLQGSPSSRFYGLGWDLLERQFKVYFRVRGLGELPAEVSGLLAGYSLDEYREEGLVSFTYTEDQLTERKVYLYPREGRTGLPRGVAREARMITDQRGDVPQYDVATPADWLERLNPAGKRIVNLYRERNETLDTIAYENPDRFTLYFP